MVSVDTPVSMQNAAKVGLTWQILFYWTAQKSSKVRYNYSTTRDAKSTDSDQVLLSGRTKTNSSLIQQHRPEKKENKANESAPITPLGGAKMTGCEQLLSSEDQKLPGTDLRSIPRGVQRDLLPAAY